MEHFKSNVYFLEQVERERYEKQLMGQFPLYDFRTLDDLQIMTVIESDEKEELMMVYKLQNEEFND